MIITEKIKNLNIELSFAVDTESGTFTILNDKNEPKHFMFKNSPSPSRVKLVCGCIDKIADRVRVILKEHKEDLKK
jgi:hypothetical protein